MTDASRSTHAHATSVAMAVRLGFQLWSGLDRLRNACMVRIAQAEQPVVSSPCVYDTGQRQITAVDASGRQQYLEVPVIQLVLFTRALVRTVWCMPRYRRTHESRHALSAPQMSLLPPFAG
jgi:hypothetical protein